MNDRNSIRFCSGMFSFGKTNDFANSVYPEVKAVFENYLDKVESQETVPSISGVDEI
jgi:hypothetical protein